jgi:hypothetical protein
MFSRSTDLVHALVEVTNSWKEVLPTIKQTDFSVACKIHSAYHSVIYILLGMIDGVNLCKAFAEVEFYLFY